jgi:ATP-dependent DNA helicase RecG
MTITNPGGLPLGITKNNILHERHRRNPHLIQLLSHLKLMEGEGSGYDLVFEKLARDAKPLPEIESTFTKVAVTIYSGSGYAPRSRVIVPKSRMLLLKKAVKLLR